jgi:hypothetical protein
LENCGVLNFEELPRPAPVPSGLLVEFESVAEVFGEYVVGCLISRDWKLREAGLGKVDFEVRSNSILTLKLLVSGLLPLLQKGVEDKIAQVFVAALSLLNTVLPQTVVFRRAELHTGVEGLVERLLERTGDSSKKIAELAGATLVALAQNFGWEREVTGLNLRLLRSKLGKLPPKAVVGRVAVLARSLAGEEGLEGAVAVGIECLKHAAAEVRAVAIALLKTCKEGCGMGGKAGGRFRELLEPWLGELRPPQRDHLFQELFPSPALRAAPMSARVSVDGVCQFCGKRNPQFALDSLAMDRHYLKECAALVECEFCHQIVEKNTLDEHLNAECESNHHNHPPL